MPLQGDSTILVTTPSSPEVSYRGIASLPPEILSHIFVIGSHKLEVGYRRSYESVKLDDNGLDDDDFFATHCSHVCQYWRAVAIDTSQLWSSLDFRESHFKERCGIWIERSKDVPLIIDVADEMDEPRDPTEREVQTFKEMLRAHAILDIILPHAHRWKSFDLVTDWYELVWLWETRLLEVKCAPILEHIGIFCHGDVPAMHETHLQPPSPLVLFPQGTPRIRSVSIWGVHFDWDLATFFTGLENLQLAWHSEDVRLTVEQFVRALRRSPKLETLILEGSAPIPGDWPQERIQLPKLVRLDLVCVDLRDAISIMDHLDFPALVKLKLDLEAEGIKDFIHAVCQTNKPRFGSIESLTLLSFHCTQADGNLFLSTLHSLKFLNLNFSFLPSHFHHSLTSHSPLLCPRLESLKLSGLGGKPLRLLIRSRQRSPVPILQLYLDQDNDLTDNTIRWLRNNVPTVEFFENSDVESDEGEDDEEDDDYDGDGDGDDDDDDDDDEDEDDDEDDDEESCESDESGENYEDDESEEDEDSGEIG